MSAVEYGELAGLLAGEKNFIVELGEQTGIGSSSLLVRKCEKTFLIDRGIAFEGYGAEKITTFPVGENLEDIFIDVMIFTHVHADHSALIIPTVKAHPESEVIFSKKTFEELKVVLADTLSIFKKAARTAYYSRLPEPTPLFTERDLAEFIACAEDGTFTIVDTDNTDEWLTFKKLPGWEFGFTFSGHTRGAFVSAIVCPDGDGLVFTGDLSGHGQETTRGVKKLSESFLGMAEFRKCRRIILVTEATNGDRNRDETLEESDARLKAVLEETERRGGQALFPVFMVNRGPNIVVKLARLGFKVFVAGGVRKTLEVEVQPELLQKWLDNGTVMFIEDGQNYPAMLRSAAKGEYGFRPIVTSSATLDQGAGVEFAIQMLPIRENVLISTGHVFAGSAMDGFFKIKDQPVETGRTIILNQLLRGHLEKIPVNVRCRGEHFDYSAHSYQNELVEFITRLRPDVVFVKHCTDSGFRGLESALREKIGENVPIERAEHLHVKEL